MTDGPDPPQGDIDLRAPADDTAVRSAPPPKRPKVFGDLSPAQQAVVQRNIQRIRQQGGTDVDAEGYLRQTVGIVPDEEAHAAARSQSSPAPASSYRGGMLGAGLLGIAESVPLSTKISAALHAFVPEQGTTFGQRYESGKEDIRQAEAEAKGEHPFAERAGQVVGIAGQIGAVPEIKEGTALARAVPRIARFSRSAAGQGATIGAIEGASDAEGGPMDYAKQIGAKAAEGAVLGPLVGAVVRPIVRGAARIANRVKPTEFGKAVEVATGPNRRALDLLEHQTKGAPVEDLTTGTVGGTRQLMAQRARDLATSGEQNFKAAYQAAQGVDDPALDKILASPQGQLLWRQAQKDAEKYGRQLPTKSVIPPAPAGINPERWQQLAEQQGVTKDVPIPDPEALHFLRKAAAKDPKLSELFEGIKGIVAQHTPNLQAAIDDYAQKARAFDILRDGQRIAEFLKPNSKAASQFATEFGDPRRLRIAKRGVEGLSDVTKNLTEPELEDWRTAAQDALGAAIRNGGLSRSVLKVTPENVRWQSVVFGSREAFQAWAEGALAKPRVPLGSDMARSVTQGGIPHSSRGLIVKGAQVGADLLRGKPTLTNPTPMSLPDVLQAMEQHATGRPAVNYLRNAGLLGLESKLGIGP